MLAVSISRLGTKECTRHQSIHLINGELYTHCQDSDYWMDDNINTKNDINYIYMHIHTHEPYFNAVNNMT